MDFFYFVKTYSQAALFLLRFYVANVPLFNKITCKYGLFLCIFNIVISENAMIRLNLHPENPQLRHIRKAVTTLLDGGLIIYPTDTVYGLGCDMFNKRAMERIYQIKGKDKKALLSFICPDLKDIAKYARVSNPAYKIMRQLLPGPYTFILEATRDVPKILLEKRKTVGIRVPDNPVCHLLLEEFGKPIISTSARPFEGDLMNDPDDLYDTFKNFVDVFLDTGMGGLEPSTIIDMTTDEPVVLREGKGFDQL